MEQSENREQTEKKEHTEHRKQKKILILANSSGGLYDFRNELVQQLLEEYEVAASLPDQVRTAELAAEGCRILPTAINRRGVNPLEDGKLLLAYLRLMKEEKPDLVLTYTIKPNIYGGLCCRMRKIPYIETVTGLGSTFQKQGVFLRLIVTLYRMGLKKAACVFFQNEENRQIFQKYRIGGGKTRLVPGSGVNLKRHCPEPYPEDETVRFLYVGRMMREKGIDELLEAARILKERTASGQSASGQSASEQKMAADKDRTADVVFELLGYCDEDYQEKLDESEKAGYIRQLGFHPEVHDYMKRASALVLPTYHEGMSNVLMEASATARPVITTNISGCKEIYEEGVTGFGCRPQSSEDLVRALSEFLKLSVRERAEMGRKAREKMEREFDRRKVADAYREEINRILSEC